MKRLTLNQLIERLGKIRDSGCGECPVNFQVNDEDYGFTYRSIRNVHYYDGNVDIVIASRKQTEDKTILPGPLFS